MHKSSAASWTSYGTLRDMKFYYPKYIVDIDVATLGWVNGVDFINFEGDDFVSGVRIRDDGSGSPTMARYNRFEDWLLQCKDSTEIGVDSCNADKIIFKDWQYWDIQGSKKASNRMYYITSTAESNFLINMKCIPEPSGAGEEWGVDLGQNTTIVANNSTDTKFPAPLSIDQDGDTYKDTTDLLHLQGHSFSGTAGSPTGWKGIKIRSYGTGDYKDQRESYRYSGRLVVGNEAISNAAAIMKLQVSDAIWSPVESDYIDALILDGTASGFAYFSDAIKLTPRANPPAEATEGVIYMDTDHHLYVHNGTTWVQLDN